MPKLIFNIFTDFKNTKKFMDRVLQDMFNLKLEKISIVFFMKLL